MSFLVTSAEERHKQTDRCSAMLIAAWEGCIIATTSRLVADAGGGGDGGLLSLGCSYLFTTVAS